ncbi:aminopeptidase [Ruminococcaceae bacterium OttesenSCG-928-L11]|nr:aminopeptidase [Ruminococcaceae bacterium OttesenSCG-928-L11]
MENTNEKTLAEQLKDQLLMNPENGGIRMDDAVIAKAGEFCEAYKTYLDNAKTEREAVTTTIKMLEKEGFVPFDAAKKYSAGDKVYLNNRGKALLFAVMGKRPLTDGVKIIASHIDSPRLDLKPRPLYEESQLAMFKTHYYGGVRKYQWTAIPLALHGVIVKKDGSTVTVAIGEAEDDPIFCINDLLPHLAKDQNQRKLFEGIRGEELNVLVGSLPFRDDKISEKVKLNIIRLLNEKYGIVEQDFLSAELTMVPAHKARDLGFDRSLIGSYGHDDRVCAYTSIMASLQNAAPECTWINILADKEETGSDGNTGLNSRFLEYFVADLAKPYGIEGRTVLSKSQCLSADVNAAFDPTFPDVAEKRNIAYIGYGVVVTKYTGSGGKGGTNDSSAEFAGTVRRILDDADVVWQTGELGKVDHGGGGTVAKFISRLGVDTIDIGVPVLSMHAPMEVVSKLDVYNTYLAFDAFLQSK